MEVGWYFYRFDYARFLALRPALRSATTPAAFGVLADSPETNAVVEAFQAGEIALSQARSAFVQAVCCIGDPFCFDRGLPHCITALGRWRETEDAADLLGEMLTGQRNMEPWLLPGAGLIGFLKPEETLALRQSYTAPRRHRNSKRRGKKPTRRRRGGLVGAFLGFVFRLFDRAPQMDAMLRSLGDLIEEAAEKGEGIAVVAA